MKLIPLSRFGLMTTAEVAEYHGCYESTVRRWVAAGALPAVPVGHAFVLRRADCEAFAPPKVGRPIGSKTRAERRKRPKV